MKGIILAGGSGTRLYPLTIASSKQLLPVYDKPMIYYPLSTLMLAGINEILLISAPESMEDFKRLLGNGERFGISLSYLQQPSPRGVAEALLLGESFLDGDCCALILGDNIFYGGGLVDHLMKARAAAEAGAAAAFCCYVRQPEQFGVVSFDVNGKVESIEEKPASPKSHYAVTGLYFYDGRAPEFARKLVPSERGELEITDLNRQYLLSEDLTIRLLGRGFTWIDAGTVGSLYEASELIRVVEERTGIMVSVPEEIAYRNGWISIEDLMNDAKQYRNSEYGHYLQKLAGKAYL